MHTLDAVRPLARRLLPLFARGVDLDCVDGPFGAVLAAHPNLVLAISHATPLSWLPIPFALAEEACEAGQGQRVPFGVVDHFFFKFAPLRPAGRFLTQAPGPQDFNALLARLQGAPGHDLVVFPEGSLSFFGDPTTIGPFRSPRFIELALRAGVPLLLVVHAGTEGWSARLPLPGGRRLNLPLPPRPVPHLRIRVALHPPSLSAADLDPDRSARRAQLEVEATRVRARMLALRASLDL